MHLCYVDESGGFEAPASHSSATPLMVIVGLMVDAAHLHALTMELLHAKAKLFPGKMTSRRFLDYVLDEIKGAELRATLRGTNRKVRRRTLDYLELSLRILEAYRARIVGRIWIKAPGQALDPAVSYTFAIQDIAMHFDHYLWRNHTEGLMICDSRMHHQNMQVSHSLFTQKHMAIGDGYPRLAETPTFGQSLNHAGLQLADVVASALLFPMAARTYCASH